MLLARFLIILDEETAGRESADEHGADDIFGD
jgi:hypothetical protein